MKSCGKWCFISLLFFTSRCHRLNWQGTAIHQCEGTWTGIGCYIPSSNTFQMCSRSPFVSWHCAHSAVTLFLLYVTVLVIRCLFSVAAMSTGALLCDWFSSARDTGDMGWVMMTENMVLHVASKHSSFLPYPCPRTRHNWPCQPSLLKQSPFFLLPVTGIIFVWYFLPSLSEGKCFPCRWQQESASSLLQNIIQYRYNPCDSIILEQLQYGFLFQIKLAVLQRGFPITITVYPTLFCCVIVSTFYDSQEWTDTHRELWCCHRNILTSDSPWTLVSWPRLWRKELGVFCSAMAWSERMITPCRGLDGGKGAVLFANVPNSHVWWWGQAWGNKEQETKQDRGCWVKNGWKWHKSLTAASYWGTPKGKERNSSSKENIRRLGACRDAQNKKWGSRRNVNF